MKPNLGNTPIQSLLNIMAQLRHPEHGCPWDLKQDFASILPYTLEEAYEVADAIEKDDKAQLKDELGDLLFQVIFYCQLGQEEHSFNFDAVCQAMVDKLIRRHPHVFGDSHSQEGQAQDNQAQDNPVKDSQAALATWEAQKQAERQAKQQTSVMDDIPHALPGILRAEKLQKRAANVGFDWPDITQAMHKLNEEVEEIKQANASKNTDAIIEELGDLMFTCVNLSRHLKASPETVMRAANNKFEQRFRTLETTITNQGKSLQDLSLTQLDEVWDEVKKTTV